MTDWHETWLLCEQHTARGKMGIEVNSSSGLTEILRPSFRFCRDSFHD